MMMNERTTQHAHRLASHERERLHPYADSLDVRICKAKPGRLAPLDNGLDEPIT